MKILTDRAERLIRTTLEAARTELRHAARLTETQTKRTLFETAAQDCADSLAALNYGTEPIEVDAHVRS